MRSESRMATLALSGARWHKTHDLRSHLDAGSPERPWGLIQPVSSPKWLSRSMNESQELAGLLPTPTD
jgi:hypothetical protein